MWHVRPRRLVTFATSIFVIVLGFAVPRGQVASSEHPGQYTQADIDAGARLYNRQCQQCHGVNGDQITGIDLRRGVFRRSSSDEDLAKVITTGVPNTAIPPFPLQPSEVTSVIAFILAGFDPAGTAVKIGNAARGQAPR